MHLIQFPEGKDYGKAIRTLLAVPRRQYLALPEYTIVVIDEHIKALNKAHVSFVYLSKTAKSGSNGKKRPPVRS